MLFATISSINGFPRRLKSPVTGKSSRLPVNSRIFRNTSFPMNTNTRNQVRGRGAEWHRNTRPRRTFHCNRFLHHFLHHSLTFHDCFFCQNCAASIVHIIHITTRATAHTGIPHRHIIISFCFLMAPIPCPSAEEIQVEFRDQMNRLQEEAAKILKKNPPPNIMDVVARASQAFQNTLNILENSDFTVDDWITGRDRVTEIFEILQSLWE